jgi:hypothetical protein
MSLSRRRWASSLALAIVFQPMAGCGGARPDLARLYAGWARNAPSRRPVVVLHGLLGSRLVEKGTLRVVWGGFRGLMGGGTAAKLALPLARSGTGGRRRRDIRSSVRSGDLHL